MRKKDLTLFETITTVTIGKLSFGKKQLLKYPLLKYNWEIDICEDVEVKDSEILLKVIEEYNKIVYE